MPAMDKQEPVACSWRQAIEAGELCVWDLRPQLELVAHSPQWKQKLGFPKPHAADRTHFWRCRVHPDDLDGMLGAMRAHMGGDEATYEATFRLRSNGSGYRVVHSRGRVVERCAQHGVLRMVGTMIDVTARPATPGSGLPDDGPRAPLEAPLFELPFHVLLTAPPPEDGPAAPSWTALVQERDRLLAQVEDLLHTAAAELRARGLNPPAAAG